MNDAYQTMRDALEEIANIGNVPDWDASEFLIRAVETAVDTIEAVRIIEKGVI